VHPSSWMLPDAGAGERRIHDETLTPAYLKIARVQSRIVLSPIEGDLGTDCSRARVMAA
jgi:hypothetical protein